MCEMRSKIHMSAPLEEQRNKWVFLWKETRSEAGERKKEKRSYSSPHSLVSKVRERERERQEHRPTQTGRRCINVMFKLACRRGSLLCILIGLLVPPFFPDKRAVNDRLKHYKLLNLLIVEITNTIHSLQGIWVTASIPVNVSASSSHLASSSSPSFLFCLHRQKFHLLILHLLLYM